LTALRDVLADLPQHWVTFDKPDARSLLGGADVSWAFSPTNRNLWNFIRNTFLATRLLWKLRPFAIVSTGAGVAVPFFYVAWFLRIRTIFIESLSRIETRSLTGRLIAPVASEIYVQWPEMKGVYKRSTYAGSLL
jgi:beta-1,4-N-acetylglucosaminyltransferase